MSRDTDLKTIGIQPYILRTFAERHIAQSRKCFLVIRMLLLRI